MLSWPILWHRNGCTLFRQHVFISAHCSEAVFPRPQLSNHIFSQCFCLALGVLIGGYGPEVALWGLLFRNNGLYEFLSCFSPPSSLQIKDPDSQSITGLNSLLGYISSWFFILYCRLKWKSSRSERHIKGKMTSEIILFSWEDIMPSPQRGLRGFGDYDERGKNIQIAGFRNSCHRKCLETKTHQAIRKRIFVKTWKPLLWSNVDAAMDLTVNCTISLEEKQPLRPLLNCLLWRSAQMEGHISQYLSMHTTNLFFALILKR